MNKLITIANAGPKIKETNYWDSEPARAGKIFFSINAGTIRALVPITMEHLIPEIKTGKKVILSRGPWPAEGRADAFEFLFDDYSDNPFALHVGTDQWILLPEKPMGGSSSKWKFAVWTQTGGLVHQKKCYYRLVDQIPCLKLWGDK